MARNRTQGSRGQLFVVRPPSFVSETILNNLNEPNRPLTKDDRLFFQYMGLVENPQSPVSPVDDFAAFER